MNKTSENWKIYTKWRNNKTKTKRESISVYFQERCGGGQSLKTSGQPSNLSCRRNRQPRMTVT